MALLGFLVAVALFVHYQRRFRYYRNTSRLETDVSGGPAGAPHAYSDWQQRWAAHQQRRRELEARHARRRRRRLDEQAKRLGLAVVGPDASPTHEGRRAQPDTGDAAILARARRRAAAEVGFYGHLMSYLGVMAFLALINLLTTRYPWFVWPAAGWGVGLFAHYMAVFGSRQLRERYFEPAVEREVRREKVMMQTDKQASLEELSSAIAHEIRNPIAAAKSLVQQMGEDPQSVENVEYAHVALDELDRVERRIAHLLKYAKDEDYTFEPANLAAIVDGALTQLRAKLDAAHVQTARHYISGPTVLADRDKLEQVFANVLDNAIDALGSVAEGRRIDLFVENGTAAGGAGAAAARAGVATVRVRDNGCGIPADKLPRIFTPFFTTKEKGTGLGMAISKKIIEAHEGSIDAVSEPGRGTEFLVTLPLPR